MNLRERIYVSPGDVHFLDPVLTRELNATFDNKVQEETAQRAKWQADLEEMIAERGTVRAVSGQIRLAELLLKEDIATKQGDKSTERQKASLESLGLQEVVLSRATCYDQSVPAAMAALDRLDNAFSEGPADRFDYSTGQPIKALSRAVLDVRQRLATEAEYLPAVNQ